MPSRWVRERYLHPTQRTLGYTYTFAAGRIDNIDNFDSELFGISPREAVQVDPQQFLLLELTHEALEDAGIPAHSVAGQRVGVYIGMSFTDYMSRRSSDLAITDGYFVTGGAMSIAANRVSHAFDLHGPSLVVDTACSSSVVALHLACQALQNGEIDTAIVGGSNLLLDPRPFIGFAQATMLSPTGRCRPFSDQADGFMRSEGCGVVVLRRQDKITAEDRPLGWVLGSGVNSDGHTLGLSVPNGVAQARLLREVYAQAGIGADDISYFEAHGTGTAVGDPIEAGAIGEALSRFRTSSPMPVSSAKSSFGHLETASGMVGLFAALAVLDRRSLPQLAHFNAPNPKIDFDALRMAPCTVSTPLPQSGRLVIGVNSFGFGGTNAHAILSSEPDAPLTETRVRKKAAVSTAMPPLLLSARSAASLEALADAWADYLDAAPAEELPAALRGAARGRSLYGHRLAVNGPDAAAIASSLRDWRAGLAPAAAVKGYAASGGIAFVFSGNGSQWAGMGRLAMRRNRSFRAAVGRLSAMMQERLGWSAVEELRLADPARLRRTDIAQPLLFVVQVALVQTLRKAGIAPSAVIGHSVGEIAAAWAAGALSLETALDVVICRSRLQQRTHGLGRMAACNLDAETAQSLFAEHGLPLDVAAHNGARSITISGPGAALAEFGAIVEERGLFFRDLDLDYAFHSRVLEPVGPEMTERLAGIGYDAPRIPFVSTVTGRVEKAPVLDAAYWWRNLRQPVLFADGLQELVKLNIGLLVEIGPHPVLQSALAEVRDAHRGNRQIIAALTREQSEGDPVAQIVAACHANGADITGTRIFDGPRKVRGLPHYQYQRRSISIPPSVETLDIGQVERTHPLLGFPIGDSGLQWRSHLDLAREPWLADHQVDGEVYLPAAAMIDMAFAAAHARFPQATALELIGLEINRPLVLEAETMREVALRIDPERDRFEIASRPRLSDTPWTVHAAGRMAILDAAPPVLEEERAGTVVEPEALYAHANEIGLQYGPGFRKVERVIVHDDHNCSVHLAAEDKAAQARARSGGVIDPVWLDAGMHGLLPLPISREEKRLPWRFGRVRLFTLFHGVPATGRIRISREGPNAAEGQMVFADASGRAMLDISDVWFVRTASRARESLPGLWTTKLVPLPAPSAARTTEAELPSEPDCAQSDAALLLDACIAAACHAALLPLSDDGRIDPRLMLESTDGSDVLRSALSALVEDGFAAQSDDGLQLSPTEAVPDWREIWRTLYAEMPDCIGELALTGAVLDAMPRSLRRGRAEMPSGGKDMRDQILADGPDGRALIDALAERVGARVAASPANRPVRVLEIGPRAGLLTRALRRRLDHLPNGLICTIACADPSSVDAAQAALGDIPGHALAWDIAEPAPAPLSLGGFDLVIGAYCSLLDRPFGQFAQTVAPLLAAGGRLLLAEPQACRFWNMVAGRDAHWGADRAELANAGLGLHVWRAVPGQLWNGQWLEATPDAASIAEPIDVAPPDAAESLLIVGEQADRLAAIVTTRLQNAGLSPSLVAPDGLAATLAQPPATLLLLAGDPDDPAPVLSTIAAAAGQLAEGAAMRFMVVTRGEASGEPAAEAIEGVVRVFGNEAQNLTWRTMRLSRAYDDDAAAAEIIAALADDWAEAELILSPSARLAPRIRPVAAPAIAGQPARLTVGQRGRIDTLHWRAMELPTPGADEVVIETEACALNFRDLMWALGMLPDEALIDGFAGPTLGLECAGRIVAVGAGVTRFVPGDRVMALAPASLASHARTLKTACVKLPDGMDFAAAATLPVAFLTVCHSLGALAQLAPGETVLIHGAAGGVGLAAVQYAQHRGAEVIATAGSPLKRALLRLLGVRHVLDSRSLAFGDEVMRLTDGRGVDVVLNSLSGKAMERSLEVLAPLGRFVELGKRDFFADTAIGLRPMRRNVSYFGVDVDTLARQQPKRTRMLFDEMAALLESGAIRPLPYRALGFNAASDAFRIMQGAGHVGKLVLTREHGAALATTDAPRFAADPNGVYVVTGGLAGFGLATAMWLAERGAKHLALLSRRGAATPGAAEALAELVAQGCNAVAWACDVSDEAALKAALASIRRDQGPIVGVLHAAMVLQDGLLANTTNDAFEAVLAPKYRGGAALDKLTRQDKLSLFVMFSSVSTLLGTPGQANYVAANAAIEAIVERRRLEGLPGLAVAWGPIGDVGVLTRQNDTARVLVRRMGSNLLTAHAALESLDRMLAQPAPVVASAILRWGDARSTLRGIATARFSEVLAGHSVNASVDETDLRALIATLTPEEAHALVMARLVETICGVLRAPASSIAPQTRLNEIGLDSLMGVELALSIEERFGITLSRAAIAEQTSVGGLSEVIVKALGRETAKEETVLENMARRYEGDLDASSVQAGQLP